MASSGKQLNVRMNFQIDTTQAQQQLKGLYSQLNQITSASAFGKNSQLGITQEIMQATKAAAQLKTAITEAVNPLTGNLDLTRFNDQLRMSGMSLNQYREQLASLGTTGNQAFNQLTRSIATAETPLLRTGKAAQTMWTVLGNTVRWQATSSLLHGILSTASQAMGYVKALDSSLNNIRIVTGQSQEQMVRFAKTANQAAKELNTSTNEYAKASLIYYQQGLSNKQVEERTRTTIKLANVAGQSAKTVSDQMTAVWNNFYNGSKSIEYYADVITALGASTASSSEEIAKGLQKFSSIAETTGLSYEYATSALATVVATTRQSADSVGTSFKTLFSRLQSLNLGETLDDGTTLNKYSQALNTVGVSIKKANGDLRDMDDILADLGSKWQNLGKDQQIALAQTVGGVRNYTGLVALMDNWDKFQENLKTAQTAQGTLQNQADIYAESWKAASDHVRTASETIYKNLLDDKFFKGLTNGFGSILDLIGSLTNSLGGFKGTMLTIGNTALQLFKPQISNGLGMLGLNIRSIFRGQQDIVDLKADAEKALIEPIKFSRYDTVNNVQQKINENLIQRQQTYDNLVSSGKIPQYLQPAYQMMFNAANAQADQTVLSVEKSLRAQEEQDFAQMKAQQELNYQASQYNKAISPQAYYAQAKMAVDKNPNSPMANIVRGMEAKNPELVNILANQYNGDASAMLNAVRNHTETYMNGGLAGITSKGFQDYAEQYRATNIATTLNTLTKGNLQGMSQEDANRAAAYITQMVSGSKELGINFDKHLSSLTSINDEIQQYSVQLQNGTITQEEFNSKVADAIKNSTTLGDEINNLIGAEARGLIDTRENLIAEAQKAAGVTNDSDQGKEIRATVSRVLTSSEMSEVQRLEAMRQLGVKDETAAALLKQLQDQSALKNTMNMSSAIATSMNAVAATGQVLTSLSNTIKVFKDDTSSASDYLSAFTANAMSIGMAVRPWQEFGKHAKDTLKIFGQESSMTVGQLGGIIAAITTLAVVGTKIYQGYQANYTTEGQLKTISGELAAQQQLVSERKSNYEELETITESYNQQLLELKNSISGSSDYYTKQAAINEIAGNLIDRYGLINGQDFSLRNGTFFIDEATQQRMAEQAEKEYLQAANQQTILQQSKNYYSAVRQMELREKDLGISGFGLYKSGGAVYASGGSQMGDRLIYTADEVKTLQENDNAYQVALSKRTSALKTIGELALEDIAQQQEIELNDLTRSVFINQKDFDTDLVKILNQVNTATIDGFWKSAGSWFAGQGITGYEGANSNEELWDMLKQRGFVSGEMPTSDEALRGALRGAMPEMLLEQRVLDFVQGIDKTISEQFANYKTLQVSEIENRVKTYLTGSENEAYRQAILQEVENIQAGLVNAMSANLSSEFIEQEGRLTKGGALDKFEQYSLAEQQQITDYLISSGSVFGNKTSQLIFNKLSDNKNLQTLEQLSKINWDNTFSALGDINQLARNIGQDGGIYSEVLQSAIDDIGSEGGLFKKLYDASGFQDVLTSLTEQFSLMGTITTEAVTKLSSKSEELNSILGLSSSNFIQLGINAAGIASLLTQINKGTLTAGQVTTDLVRSLSVAGNLEAEEYRAFDVVDNQDYGRSGTDLLDFFGNAQKYYINAKSQNLTYDSPLRGIFDHMMPGDIRKSYYDAILAGNGKTFDEIIKMLPQNVQDFLNKTNKKGTKGIATWSDIIDLYGDFFQGQYDTEQTLAEFLMSGEGGGISFENGNIHLFTDKNGNFNLTTDKLKDRLFQAFKAMDMSDEDADSMASMWLGYIANTSAGAQIEQQDAEQALQEFINRPGQENTLGEFTGKRLVSSNELATLYNTYGAQLGYSNYEDFEKYVLGQMQGSVLTPNTYNLRNQVWNQGINEKSLETIGNLFAEANTGLNLPNGIEGFKSLMETYGVYNKDNTIDVNKFKELIEFLNGTEAQADELLKTIDVDELGKLSTVFTDKFGNNHNLIQGQNESVESYSKRVTQEQNEANSDYYWDPVSQEYVFDPLGYKREQVAQNVVYTDDSGTKATTAPISDYWRQRNSYVSERENPPVRKQVTLQEQEEALAPYEEYFAQLGKALGIDPDQVYSYMLNNELTKDTGKWLSGVSDNSYVLKNPITGEFIQANYDSDLNSLYQLLDTWSEWQARYEETIQSFSERQASDDRSYRRQKEQYDQAYENYITTNAANIEGAAKDYSSAIDARIQAGRGVNSYQAALSALYHEYEGSTDEAQRNLLLKKIDYLMSGVDQIVDYDGQLVDLQEGEEGQKSRLRAQTNEDGTTTYYDEEGNEIDVPAKEPVTGQGSGDSGWYQGPAAKTDVTFTFIVPLPYKVQPFLLLNATYVTAALFSSKFVLATIKFLLFTLNSISCPLLYPIPKHIVVPDIVVLPLFQVNTAYVVPILNKNTKIDEIINNLILIFLICLLFLLSVFFFFILIISFLLL